MSYVWVCTLRKWWSVLVSVLTAVYVIVVTVIVTRPSTSPFAILQALILPTALFLLGVLAIVYLMVRFNILVCKK